VKKIITKYIRDYLVEKRMINENNVLINRILDKLNKEGKFSLSQDEKKYLEQYSKNIVDKGLEMWLLSNNDTTFDIEGEKLLYDEFKEDEDIFYNREKLKRVINKHLKKTPFTNNADWGGAFVWNIKSENMFIGVFIFLDDDELLLLRRYKNEYDEYEDNIIKKITNTKE